MSAGAIHVAALYRFTPFPDPTALRAPLLAACEDESVKGTLLLAQEGINGTIAGRADGLAHVLAAIRPLPGCAALDVKHSRAAAMPSAVLPMPGWPTSRGVNGRSFESTTIQHASN